MRATAMALLLLFAGSFGGFAAEEDPYLFDLLKRPNHLSAWKAMLKGETVPSWISNYAKSFDGPSAPSKPVEVGAETYLLGWVCKAHDCGDNQLYVLFASDGKQAWGLLIARDDQRKWLGRPDAAIKAAIEANLQ